MSISEILNVVGAVMTVALGCLGLFAPARARALTQLEAPTPSAFGEFRSTFGGLFVGLGVATLVLGSTDAYLVLRIGWLATAVGRVLSIVADPDGRDSRNVQSLGLEAVIAILLLV
jgi:hypothetical protein